MIRKCYTINPNRTKEEIQSYKELLLSKEYVGVEIFYPYRKTKEEIEIYKNAVLEYQSIENVEYVCHLPYGPDSNLATFLNIDEIMLRFKNAIDFASNFNVKKLTLHPGFNDSTLSRSDAIKTAATHIKELCRYARKYEMIVMLENLIGDTELMRTPEEYFELKNLIQEDNLKFIFDAAHYHASKFCNNTSQIVEFLHAVKDDLMHLHISDNDGTRDMHARIGLGTIDYSMYFKELQKVGYTGLYSSEVLFNSVSDLRQTAIDMDNELKK